MTQPPSEYRSCLIGQAQHRPHDGMLICAHHAQELATMLRDIEDEAALLDPRKGGGSGAATKPTGLASEQSPVKLDVLVLTDHRRNAGRLTQEDHDPHGLDDTPEALDVLGSWARVVRDERRLAAPMRTVVLQRFTVTAHGPLCWHPPLSPCAHVSCSVIGHSADITVTDTVLEPAYLGRERALLSRQLSWIVEQPWVDEMHAQLHELLAYLRRANSTQRVPAGRCETVRDAQECGGTIWHVALEHDEGQPEPAFQCDRCRVTWTGTGALRLRDQLGRQSAIGGAA